ncbi:MAG: hypothetical protein ACREQV_01110 [Candidatus Binatia bacterium]
MHRLVSMILSFVVYVSTPALAGIAVPLPSLHDISLKELIPLAAWNKQFTMTEGRDRGKVVPLTFRRDSATPGHWNLTFGDYAGILMQSDSRRGLVMERIDLIKSRSYIVYDPALPILASDITSGAAIRHQASFKMYDAVTGKLKRTGRVTHRVKQVSPSRFDTPAGLIDGYYIEIDHRMDMQYAQLHMTLGLGCRLDYGPVFGSGQYTLTKLGIFRDTKTAAAALTQTNNTVSPLR